jgi:hypothetical protein
MPGSQGDAGDRAEQMRRAGLATAVALAREQGLPADDPRVLSSRANLLVHLATFCTPRPLAPGAEAPH